MEPEERLFAALVRLAIRDATQNKNERLRIEALRWLWWVAPSIAQRAGIQTNRDQHMAVQSR